jgi:hypothetical protein
MNQQQQYKNSDTPLLMMLARFALQDCSQTSSQHAVLGCDATTCDHQHSQCRQCLTQNELAAGVHTM